MRWHNSEMLQSLVMRLLRMVMKRVKRPPKQVAVKGGPTYGGEQVHSMVSVEMG